MKHQYEKISTPHHITPVTKSYYYEIWSKHGDLVGNVGDEHRVSEKEGEAFVANFPLATNQFYRNNEGEEVSKTAWHQIVNMSGTFLSPTFLREMSN